jgi:hypothetical protein
VGNDNGRAVDGLSVGVLAPLSDSGFGTTRWRIERWNEKQVRLAQQKAFRIGLPGPVEARTFRFLEMEPYETSEFVGNLITTAGWTRLMSLLTNQSATQALDATHTRIGVGNGTTPAEAYGDTDLAASAGSTNRWFQPVSGAGSLGTRTLAFAATFGTSDGNFAWNEMGLDVTTSTAAGGNTVGALLFNHKVGVAQGTKASGQVWTATATLTFT